MRETWFLHVEVRHLKCTCVPCLPHDTAILSKYRDLMTCDCENKTRCNSEKKRMERFQPRAYLLEEHEATNHVLKEKGNSHENYTQNAASGMPERCFCRFGDKPNGAINKSQYVMPENRVENLVELHANSMQGSPSKMSTQVISVTGIINKYFSGFNGIDNFSSSSNSDVTSRAVNGEIEVQSKTRSQSCSRRQTVSLPQFTPKTPPHVLQAPLHVDLVSKNSGSKGRRSKVGKSLVLASRSLGVTTTKHSSPSLSFCRFKDKKLLEDKSQINGSIFSMSESDG